MESFPSSRLGDYAVLLKPRVMGLVFFTAFTGFLLAPGHVPFLEACISLLAIAVGSGGAGAFNMWYEKEVDAKMNRTRQRPLPAKVIHPEDALAFSLLLSIFSVVLLGFASHYGAALLLIFTLFFYGIVYTMWLKPRTPQNIVIGGLAGALPPLMGWMVVSKDFSWFPFLLVLIIFLWTPVHFWALALYTQEDYKKANIPMLPVVAGPQKTKRAILVYALLTVASSFLPFLMGFLGKVYLTTALLLGGGLFYCSFKIEKKKDKDSLKLFSFSIVYLFVLFLTMLVDHFFCFL